MQPWAFRRWRKAKKAVGESGSLAEAFGFLVSALLSFLFAALLIAKADNMPQEGSWLILIYFFKAGIPIYLLWMLFRELLDAYF